MQGAGTCKGFVRTDAPVLRTRQGRPRAGFPAA